MLQRTTTDHLTPDGHQQPATRPRSPLATLLGMAGGLGGILILLLLVFVMPSLKSGAHDLPVGVTGDDTTAQSLEQGLAAAAPGAFLPERFGTTADLETAVIGREVSGGFVLDDSGIRAVVASAGSPAVSGAITATAEAMGELTGAAVSVDDIVPLPAQDPTGVGIGGLAFPLVFGGIVPAVAFQKAFPRSMAWRLAGIITFAALGGLVVAGVLHLVFGSIQSDVGAVAAALALGIAALALPLAGLQEAFGGKGFTLGAMCMMFLGNPLAGISTTAAWLPAGLGAFGQVLPPGAAGTLVRSVAYFGGAGGLTAALTLTAWVVAGAVLHAVARRRSRTGGSIRPGAVPTAPVAVAAG